MKRRTGLFCAALAMASASPAFAEVNRFQKVLSDFSTLFSEQAVPREVVRYPGNHKPGTIIVSTRERRLYFVLGHGEAVRYGVGVGREGFSWAGTKTVTNKREWPDWTPPSDMLKRRPDLPRHMEGGSKTRSARAPSIWVRAFIASTAPTSPKPSAPPSPPAASA